jgi:ABC-type nitrate/sulfonate/bicarbonate transport system substrate-binding protein
MARRTVLFPAFLLLGGLLAFGALGCRRSVAAGPGDRITLAYTVQPQSTLVNVATAEGFLAAEGLVVVPVVHTYGKACLQDVVDGKADFATVAETPFMFSVLKGEKITIVANIEASTMNNAVVARRDRGISEPAHLRGKRIAFTPGTTSEVFMDAILLAIGLPRTGIQGVPMPPDEMERALVEGRVDAACTWNYPLTVIKRRLGANGILIYDREVFTETFNIAARQAFVRENPAAVERLLRALIRAEGFVKAHPGEAQAILSKATGRPPDLVREVWNSFHYRVVLDPTLLITLEDETRWAMKNNLADQKAMPDYRDYIHLDSLRAVRPEAVRFMR